MKKSKKGQKKSQPEPNLQAVIEEIDTAFGESLAFSESTTGDSTFDDSTSDASILDENDPELMKLSELSGGDAAEIETPIAAQETVEADEEAALGSELENFESAEVEDVGTLSEEQISSVVESMLFATDKPISASIIKAAFAGFKVKVSDIRNAIERLNIEYSNPSRGVTVEEVAGGFQLRTKPENMTYLRQTVKSRSFKLSGPALEVLAIVAYKQPCTKAMVDEVRGVESGHLMRGLLERGIIRFFGKSELPGRPMLYETSRKFLEIFGLRNIKELPSINEIEQIIPEGIDETTSEKETLGDLTGRLSEQVVGKTYSEGEEELTKISDELANINTSSEFFEAEKQRMKDKAEADKAQDIRERVMVGEDVSTRDKNWLERYDAAKVAAATAAAVASATAIAAAEVAITDGPSAEAIVQAEAAFEAEIASEDESAPMEAPQNFEESP